MKRCILSFFTVYFLSAAIYSMPGNFTIINGGDFIRKDNFGIMQNVSVKSFIISKDLVKVSEWEDYLRCTSSTDIHDWENRILYLINDNYYVDSLKIDSDYPAICISWYEAVEFCNWKSKADGLTPVYQINTDKFDNKEVIWDKEKNGYRLPTEAEWEYMSGISSSTTKIGEYEFLLQDVLKDAPAPSNFQIPSGKKNEYGISNLWGPVFQYCWDLYNEHYFTIDHVNDPLGPSSFFAYNSDSPTEEIRVIRGASYFITASDLYNNPRVFVPSNLSNGLIGIRLARN